MVAPKYCMILFSCTLLLASSVQMESSQGAEKKPLAREDIEKLESLRDMMDKVNDLEKAADRVVRKKYIDCLKAFGAPAFCDCLKERLPVIVNFAQYVQIVTSSREELGYSKLDTDSRSVIDTTLKARESCISQVR